MAIDLMSETTNHNFTDYLYQKKFTIKIQPDRYLIFSNSGKQEIIEALSAAEALQKSTLLQIIKISYLGLYNDIIVDSQNLM